MAEVDLLLVPRQGDRTRDEKWDVVEEEEEEDDDPAPRGEIGANVSDDLPSVPRQPRGDVNMDVGEEEEDEDDDDDDDDDPASREDIGDNVSEDSPPAPKQPRVDVDIDDVEEAGPVDGDSRPPQRKKHRRGKSKKRKWKPYYKLTWTEKQELENRESIRANRVREQRFRHGQPVAPYNTTQFLMEDHNVQEPDLEHIANGHHHRHHRESTSLESSDEFYSSPEDEEEFLQKEFSAVYESIHAERLNSMSKSELIQEYIQLEDRVDKLEQKLKVVEETRSFSPIPRVVVTSTKDSEVQADTTWDSDSENLEKIRIFQEEIRILVEVNERLRIENQILKEKTDSAVEGTDKDEL